VAGERLAGQAEIAEKGWKRIRSVLADEKHRTPAVDALDPDAVTVRFAEDFRSG
jgi:hypothetical protein